MIYGTLTRRISFRQIAEDRAQSKGLSALWPAGLAAGSPGECIKMHPRHIVGDKFLQKQRGGNCACKSARRQEMQDPCHEVEQGENYAEAGAYHYRFRTNSARSTRPFIPSKRQSISCASPVKRMDDLATKVSFACKVGLVALVIIIIASAHE